MKKARCECTVEGGSQKADGWKQQVWPFGPGFKETEQEMEIIDCSNFRFPGVKEKTCGALNCIC